MSWWWAIKSPRIKREVEPWGIITHGNLSNCFYLNYKPYTAPHDLNLNTPYFPFDYPTLVTRTPCTSFYDPVNDKVNAGVRVPKKEWDAYNKCRKVRDDTAEENYGLFREKIDYINRTVTGN